MLPFLKLKNQKQTGVLVRDRQPDGTTKENASDGSEDSSGLNAAAEDLCKALEAKDYSAAASALRAAFEILDSQPHEEGEHTNEEPNEE